MASELTKRVIIDLSKGLNERDPDWTFQGGFVADQRNLRRGIRNVVPNRPADLSSSHSWSTTGSVPPNLVGIRTNDVLLFPRADHSAMTVTDGIVQPLLSTVQFDSFRQSAWFPTDVVASFSPVIGNTDPYVATGFHPDGNVVTANKVGDNVNVTITKRDGSTVWSTVVSNALDPLSRQLAVTTHRGWAVVWWTQQSGAARQLRAAKLTRTTSGYSVTLTPTLIDLNTGDNTPWVITSDSNNVYAYLVARNLSDQLDVTAYRIDTTLFTSTWSSSDPDVAPQDMDQPKDVCLIRSGSIDCLVMHYVSGTEGQVVRRWVVNASDGATLRGPESVISGFDVCTSIVGFAGADTRISGTYYSGVVSFFGNSNQGTNELVVVPLMGTGTPIVDASFFGRQPVGRAALWVVPSPQRANVVPIIPFVARYVSASSNVSTDPVVPSVTQHGYVSDNAVQFLAIDLFSGSSGFTSSPVLRLNPFVTWGDGMAVGSSVAITGSTLTYVQPIYTTGIPTTSSVGSSQVVVDLDPQSVPSANAGQHLIIAGGQPTYFDGKEIVEVGPLYAPYISASAGGSTTWPTGSYFIRGLVQWTDAQGELHRSAPTEPLAAAAGSPSPFVEAIAFSGMRNGSSQVRNDVEFYATEDGGLTYFQVTAALTTDEDGRRTYSGVDVPVAGTPILFTEGGELAPFCPPALWDVASVNGRVWGVDAVNRQRLYFTKTKRPGVAYEWAPENEVVITAGAGKVIAVEDGGGQPLFLCERGIYTVGGDGPDNNGLGSFSQPYRLAEVSIHPAARQTSFSFPGGVFLESTKGPCIMRRGGGLELVSAINVQTGSRLSAWYQQSDDTIRYVVSGTLPYLINATTLSVTRESGSAGGRPVHWGSSFVFTSGSSAKEGSLVATDRALWVAQDSLVGTGSKWSFDTGWVVPEGLTGAEVNFSEWRLTGMFATTGSGLTVTEYADYDMTTSASISWTSTELAVAMGGPNTPGIAARWKARATSQRKVGRAFRVVVQETGERASGDGFLPLFLEGFYTVAGDGSRSAARIK